MKNVASGVGVTVSAPLKPAFATSEKVKGQDTAVYPCLLRTRSVTEILEKDYFFLSLFLNSNSACLIFKQLFGLLDF